MKKMLLILSVNLSIFNLTSCSEENSSVANATNDSGLTGKKFVDAAATKIMLHNAGMGRKNANCIVKYITEDGQIGVGEINQMHLTSKTMSQNATRLNKAYSAAMQACQ